MTENQKPNLQKLLSFFNEAPNKVITRTQTLYEKQNQPQLAPSISSISKMKLFLHKSVTLIRQKTLSTIDHFSHSIQHPKHDDSLNYSKDTSISKFKSFFKKATLQIGSHTTNKVDSFKRVITSNSRRDNNSSLVMSQIDEGLIDKNAFSFNNMTLELSMNTNNNIQQLMAQGLGSNTNQSHRELNFDLTLQAPILEQQEFPSDNHEQEQSDDQNNRILDNLKQDEELLDDSITIQAQPQKQKTKIQSLFQFIQKTPDAIKAKTKLKMATLSLQFIKKFKTQTAIPKLTQFFKQASQLIQSKTLLQMNKVKNSITLKEKSQEPNIERLYDGKQQQLESVQSPSNKNEEQLQQQQELSDVINENSNNKIPKNIFQKSEQPNSSFEQEQDAQEKSSQKYSKHSNSQLQVNKSKEHVSEKDNQDFEENEQQNQQNEFFDQEMNSIKQDSQLNSFEGKKFQHQEITHIQNKSHNQDSSYSDASQIFQMIQQQNEQVQQQGDKILVQDHTVRSQIFDKEELLAQFEQVNVEIKKLKQEKPIIMAVKTQRKALESPFKPNYKKLAEISDDNEAIYKAKSLVRRMNMERKQKQQRVQRYNDKVDQYFSELYQYRSNAEELKQKFEEQRKQQIEDRIMDYKRKKNELQQLQQVSHNFVRKLCDVGPQQGKLAYELEENVLQIKGGKRQLKLKNLGVQLPKLEINQQQRKYLNEQLSKESQEEMIRKYEQNKKTHLLKRI